MGYTLIELITTLTIAGVLTALAVPMLTTFVQNQRLSTQANDLLADLTFARSEAVKRGATITVCKRDASTTPPNCDTGNTAPWSRGWIVFIDTVNPASGQVDAGETVLRVHDAVEGNNFVTSALTSTALAGMENAAVRVRFRSNGSSTIDPTSDAPVGAIVGAQTGIARFRFCDSRGVGSALSVELAAMGRPRVNSTRPFDLNTCPTSSNW
jgi:type IV fimbrial biogenesis protein FimT